jgi:serine/threonine protein kinase
VAAAASGRHAKRVEDLLLARRESLKAEVVRCFQKVAGGRDTIELDGLRRFRVQLSAAIGVPQEVLGDLHKEFVRFDFNGDGRLHFNEAYKLVKHHLWMHLKGSGRLGQVDVPSRSLDEAGYIIREELGRGSQGVVLLANDRCGQERCIKRYPKSKMTARGLSELKDEFEAIQRLSCDFIAHAFEIFQDEQFYYTVGQAYYGGDLCTLQDRAREQGVALSDELWWRDLLCQCFGALAFMHEQAMMHCDIKEPNIMLKTRDLRQPEIALIDFGVSRAMAATETGRFGGTPGYIPPETWEARTWFPSGDVFSMGVCAMQLLTDEVPMHNRPGNRRGLFLEGCPDLAAIQRATLTREPPFHRLSEGPMPGVCAVVRGCLQKRMLLRPRAPQVLKEPWFQSGRPSHLPPAAAAAAAASPVRPPKGGGCSDHLLRTTGISEELYAALASRLGPPSSPLRPVGASRLPASVAGA